MEFKMSKTREAVETIKVLLRTGVLTARDFDTLVTFVLVSQTQGSAVRALNEHSGYGVPRLPASAIPDLEEAFRRLCVALRLGGLEELETAIFAIRQDASVVFPSFLYND